MEVVIEGEWIVTYGAGLRAIDGRSRRKGNGGDVRIVHAVAPACTWQGNHQSKTGSG